MITDALDPVTAFELERLNRALGLYIVASRLSIREALEKKANDLRIQLFRGYWQQRWRGSRRGAVESRGIAFAQMRARARQGQGVRIRPGTEISADAPTIGLRRQRQGARATFRLSPYQRLVWTELARRQAGVGVLGVAFLLRRWHYRQGGRRLGANVTRGVAVDVQGVTRHQQESFNRRRVIGEVVLGPNFAELSGFVEGQSAVASRHSILISAMRAVTTDMEPYLARKFGEDWRGAAAANRLRLRAA